MLQPGYFFKTRTTRKKKKRKTRYISLNNKIKQVVNRSKELKFKINTISSTVPVSGTSEIIYCSGIAEGDSEVARDGKVIYVHNMLLTLRITADTDATADSTYRIMIFRMKHNVKGVLPTVIEILEADFVWEHPQHDNRGDYQVIYDRWGIVPVATTTGDSHARLVSFKKYFKNPKKVTYDGAGSLIADAEAGHFFLMLMSDKVTGQQLTWNGEFTLNFKE